MKAKFAKKLALLLALVMICSCFSTLLLACEEEDACVSHVDSDGDNICDVCQAELNSENNGEINVPTGDAEYIMYFCADCSWGATAVYSATAPIIRRSVRCVTLYAAMLRKGFADEQIKNGTGFY